MAEYAKKSVTIRLLISLSVGTVFLGTVCFASAASPTSPHSFNKNLTVGSSGADVTALQTFLISQGFHTRATGYFGALTKTAIAEYQKAHSIQPAIGYFGPLTRAALYAHEVSLATSNGLPTTGTVQGSTTPNTAASASGPSGIVQITLAGNPSNNGNIKTSLDTPVYGLTFQAMVAPVTINKIDLQVQDYRSLTAGSNSENPGTFINTIKVWNGSNLIKTWAINSSSFIQNPNDATVFYIPLSGLDYTLPAGTATNLTVTISTNQVDTYRTLVIKGYSGEVGSNILTTSGGITNYYGIDGTNFTRTETFKNQTQAIVSLASDDTNAIGYGNYQVDPNGGLSGADSGVFKVLSANADSVITDLFFNVSASGTVPLTIYVYDPDTSTSTPIGSASPQGFAATSYDDLTTGSVTFHNLHIPVTADQAKTLDVQIDMPGNIVEGSYVSVGDATTTVTYQTSTGNTRSITSNTMSLYPSYFYTAAPVFSPVSNDISTTLAPNTGKTQTLTGTFVVTFQPLGGSMNPVSVSDILVDVATDTTNYIPVLNVSVTISPNAPGVYAQGATYTATIVATAFNADLPSNGQYTFYLDGFNWTMTNGVTVNPNYFFGNMVILTKPILFTK